MDHHGRVAYTLLFPSLAQSPSRVPVLAASFAPRLDRAQSCVPRPLYNSCAMPNLLVRYQKCDVFHFRRFAFGEVGAVEIESA